MTLTVPGTRFAVSQLLAEIADQGSIQSVCGKLDLNPDAVRVALRDLSIGIRRRETNEAVMESQRKVDEQCHVCRRNPNDTNAKERLDALISEHETHVK